MELSAAAVREAVLLVGFVVLAACGREAEKPPPLPDKLVLTAAEYDALPGWAADAVAEAVPALRRSCAKIVALPADRTLGPAGTPADWREPCAAAAAVPAGDDAAARAFFERWFRPYRAANNDDPSGLFTGYYEPELRGARRPDARFATPLYRRPPELVMVDLGEFRPKLKGERIAGKVVDGRLRPYADRAGIAAGALAGRGLELLWVDDPVDAFFLHVQGSGRVVLPDGSAVRVGYDGQNGHPYVAIGRELIARGALTREAVSLQTIRAWLAAHPDEAAALMAANPSYVFFRELAGEGPVGAQGVVLTPRRSLAVDRAFVPLGIPVWLDAEHPAGEGRRLQTLLVAQDTGGAIRGPVRGDVFWGAGEEAEALAGVMKSEGSYWLLLPRTAAQRVARN